MRIVTIPLLGGEHAIIGFEHLPVGAFGLVSYLPVGLTRRGYWEPAFLTDSASSGRLMSIS
jgi:hypothetical protein